MSGHSFISRKCSPFPPVNTTLAIRLLDGVFVMLRYSTSDLVSLGLFSLKDVGFQQRSFEDLLSWLCEFCFLILETMS